MNYVGQGGKGECESLAGASLGNPNDVSAAGNDWPALGLDGSRLTEVFADGHHRRILTEVRELQDGFETLSTAA